MGEDPSLGCAVGRACRFVERHDGVPRRRVGRSTRFLRGTYDRDAPATAADGHRGNEQECKGANGGRRTQASPHGFLVSHLRWEVHANLAAARSPYQASAPVLAAVVADSVHHSIEAWSSELCQLGRTRDHSAGALEHLGQIVPVESLERESTCLVVG